MHGLAKVNIYPTFDALDMLFFFLLSVLWFLCVMCRNVDMCIIQQNMSSLRLFYSTFVLPQTADYSPPPCVMKPVGGILRRQDLASHAWLDSLTRSLTEVSQILHYSTGMWCYPAFYTQFDIQPYERTP